MSRFQFVADHRHAFEGKRLCEIVQVARSSFYAWQHAAPTRAARAAADAQLADRIRAVHDQDRTQGAPRITAEFNDGAAPGQQVNRTRVPGHARPRHRGVAATPPGPHHDPRACPAGARPAAPRLTALAPNQRYVGDITYLAIADGSNLYLATGGRLLLPTVGGGWAITEHMRTTWSPTRSPPPTACGVCSWGRSSTPITEQYSAKAFTPALPATRGDPVGGRGYSNAPTTRWPSRSAPRSNAKHCKARTPGQQSPSVYEQQLVATLQFVA